MQKVCNEGDIRGKLIEYALCRAYTHWERGRQIHFHRWAELKIRGEGTVMGDLIDTDLKCLMKCRST